MENQRRLWIDQQSASSASRQFFKKRQAPDELGEDASLRKLICTACTAYSRESLHTDIWTAASGQGIAGAAPRTGTGRGWPDIRFHMDALREMIESGVCSGMTH